MPLVEQVAEDAQQREFDQPLGGTVLLDPLVGRHAERREIIAKSVDDGNIIEGYAWKTGGAYCACNVNVCLFANAYKKFGPTMNSFRYLSDFNLAYDKDTCIRYGACEARCPMKVIEADEEGFRVAREMCFHCGQCGTVCLVGARKLVAKDPGTPSSARRTSSTRTSRRPGSTWHWAGLSTSPATSTPCALPTRS